MPCGFVRARVENGRTSPSVTFGRSRLNIKTIAFPPEPGSSTGVLGRPVARPRILRRHYGAIGLLQHDERLSSIGPITWSIHLFITLLAAMELLREEAGGWVPVWAVALAILSLAMIFLH